MKSSIAHNIKHRTVPNDEFFTPELLAKKLIEMVNFNKEDIILSSAYGTGNFYKHFPKNKKFTKDFFNWNERVDWIIDNPPYSKLDNWLDHSADVCDKGFAYLLGLHNITPK
jgi:type I restriction-modification system DNA methylase subunit